MKINSKTITHNLSDEVGDFSMQAECMVTDNRIVIIRVTANAKRTDPNGVENLVYVGSLSFDGNNLGMSIPAYSLEPVELTAIAMVLLETYAKVVETMSEMN